MSALAIAALALTLTGAACTAPAATPKDDGTLSVTVQIGGMFTDSPSSYIVHVRRTRGAPAVATGVTPGTDTHAAPLTVMTSTLRRGRYVVTTTQRGCGMNGRACPEDADSREYDAAAWSCTAAVALPTHGRAVVRVGDVPGGSPGQRQCPVLTYRVVGYASGAAEDSRASRSLGFTLLPLQPGRRARLSPADAVARCAVDAPCDQGPPDVFLARVSTTKVVERLAYVLTWPQERCWPTGGARTLPGQASPHVTSQPCVMVDLVDARTGAYLFGGSATTIRSA